MNGFFNMDNPVMRFLGKTFDVMVLCLLWAIFSIPIITIGASTTALYYTTVKVIRRDRGYILKEFWKSFRMNFLQATICWLIVVGGTALFCMNLKFACGIEGDMGTLLMLIYGFLGILVLGCGAYIFPVLSRFTMKTIQLLKTCVFLFFKYIPRSILLLLIVAVTVFLLYIMPGVIFILPASAALVFSFVMEPILKIYTPHEEDGEEKKDEWYLE
ncbi:MAG: DUF624 domain-containing protein [Clostridium sp.]|nr:DUF624 domain-containing protein [Clostridium sp.]